MKGKIIFPKVIEFLLHSIAFYSISMGVEIIEVEIMPDHVHLLISVDPQLGVHKAIKQIKGASSRILRSEFPWLKSRLSTLWTNHYFISSVGGTPLAKIREYVKNQKFV